MTNRINGYFTKKEDHYGLVIADVDKNTKVLEKYNEVFDGIKNDIEQINMVNWVYMIKTL